MYTTTRKSFPYHMLRGCRSLLNSCAQRCYSGAFTVNNCRTLQAPSNRVSKKTVHYPFTWVLSHRRWGVRHVEKKLRNPWQMDYETKMVGRVAAQLLRHKAQKLGLDIRPDGYVRVRDVVRSIASPLVRFPELCGKQLDTPSFRNMYMETFLQMIKNNTVYLQLAYETDGVDSETKIPWVRARAGHTIPVGSGAFVEVASDNLQCRASILIYGEFCIITPFQLRSITLP
jgi:hypothetical protein